MTDMEIPFERLGSIALRGPIAGGRASRGTLEAARFTVDRRADRGAFLRTLRENRSASARYVGSFLQRAAGVRGAPLRTLHCICKNQNAASDDGEIETRLEELKAIEAALIADPDPEFRFHSGSAA